MINVDDEDEDQKNEAAPVKLEKKYGPKCVSTVNMLDDRLIPYDLVSFFNELLHFFNFNFFG